MPKQIPDRWLAYEALGKQIAGTRFISFKVPLLDRVFEQMSEETKFTPEILLQKCPSLQFIVDLTNTNRYYNSKVFTDRGLHYKKILTPGHVIPAATYIKEFFDTVDAFLSMPAEPESSLIGVHCTHGLNRTSYFVCCYMIHRLGFKPDEAIEAFEEARGHKIERDNYISDLLKGGKGSEGEEVTANWRRPVQRVDRQRHTPYRHLPYANPYSQRPAGRSLHDDRSYGYNETNRFAPPRHPRPRGAPAPWGQQAPYLPPYRSQFQCRPSSRHRDSGTWTRPRPYPSAKPPDGNRNPANRSLRDPSQNIHKVTSDL